MTSEILLTLAVTAGALGLFVWNRLRVDVVALIIMATLMLTGLVTPAQGISGFANEATVTVAAMFVLSAGLLRTGGINVLARWIATFSGKSEFRLMLLTVLLVMVASAFVNNTPVVVVMVPVVMGIARKMNISPSRILMPLSFGSQLGGTLTLIGTSTNLLVAGLIVQFGLPRLGLFDFTLAAGALALVGLAYMLTVGRWLTPVRDSSDDILANYELREYLSTLVVEPDSPLAGKSLGEARFETQYGLQIVGIDRNDIRISAPNATTVIQTGDLLFVRGSTADLTAAAEVARLTVAAPARSFGDEESEKESRLAEMIVLPRSPVAGESLRSANFRTNYGIAVLGIQRHGAALREHLADVRLAPGDVLLVQGTSDQLMALHNSPLLALIGAVDVPATRSRKLPVAIAIMAGVVLLAALNVMPILLSAIVGVVAMFLTGCLTPEEAYKEVDWMVLVLLGSLIPLGLAMQNTGAAAFLAKGIVAVAAPLGPVGILLAIYLLTSILTEAISNNAAVLVLTPIAIATAEGMGISPMPLVIAVMFAASNSFMTPIGYQTNTFIFGPGGYRFSDFLRVGGPLNMLMVITAAFVIPYFFPF